MNHTVFFAAFTLAHRALCAAAILRRAAADITLFGAVFLAAVCRALAQRALWAAAIRARAAAESFRVPYVLPKAARAAVIPRSSLVKWSCSFFNSSTTPAKLDIEFPSELILSCVGSCSSHLLNHFDNDSPSLG
jgi:hypothetical protein